MFQIEAIPDGDTVYRLVHIQQFERTSQKLPRESMFAPREGEDGLSVDWSRYSTPETMLIRCGLTYRHQTTEYKDPTTFRVFCLKVGAVREIGLSVNHDPVFSEDPPPIGSPNNQSHSLIGSPNNSFLKFVKDLRDLAVAGEAHPDMNFVLAEITSLKA